MCTNLTLTKPSQISERKWPFQGSLIPLPAPHRMQSLFGLAPQPGIALDGATLKRTRILPHRNPCLGDDFSMKHSQLCEWHSPTFPVGRWQIPGYVFFQGQPPGRRCGDTQKHYQSFENPPAHPDAQHGPMETHRQNGTPLHVTC